MAFKATGSLNPHGAPVLRAAIVTNSVVVTEQDSMKITSGFAALGTTGVLVFGHVVSINTIDGVGVNTDGTAGAAMGSFAGTYTYSSTNQTVAKSVVMCDISKYSLYSAEEDVAIGTTTGSNLLGYTQDLVDEDTLDESSALTTTGQYMGWGLDPADSTKALVNIYESLIFGV